MLHKIRSRALGEGWKEGEKEKEKQKPSNYSLTVGGKNVFFVFVPSLPLELSDPDSQRVGTFDAQLVGNV